MAADRATRRDRVPVEVQERALELVNRRLAAADKETNHGEYDISAYAEISTTALYAAIMDRQYRAATKLEEVEGDLEDVLEWVKVLAGRLDPDAPRAALTVACSDDDGQMFNDETRPEWPPELVEAASSTEQAEEADDAR